MHAAAAAKNALRGMPVKRPPKGPPQKRQFIKKKKMLNELAIFQKTYELIQYLYPLVNKFPKAQRFVLGQRIEGSAIGVLEGIIMANSLKDKGAALEKTSVELEKLRVFMRLGKDLKFMSFEQYEHASALINEIGRMLGGWVKTQKT